MLADSNTPRDPTFNGFDITGNPPVFEQLVELLRTEKAIAFVGAGASAPLYPLWQGFIQQLAAHAVTQRRADARRLQHWCSKASHRPDQIAKHIRGTLLPGEFADFMRTTFGTRQGADGLPFTPTHGALARLPFQGYVTTNYDRGLEEACAKLRPERSPKSFRWDDDDVSLWCREPPQDPRELPIFHAHGDVRQIDSIVLGIDDYRQVYTEQHAYLDLLGHLMGRERLVFVGFGFTDPWLVSFADRVATISKSRERTKPRHIAIVGLPEDEIENADLHAQDLEESLHARVLFYPIRNGSHSALDALFDALLHRVQVQRTDSGPAGNAAPKADLLDCWFDHVIDTHRRLVDCFDRPGRLSLIEEAWVELQVRADALTSSEDLGDRGGHRLVGRKLALAEVINLDATSAPWVTGRWLLEGSPGSGKTTMLRHYAWTLASSRDRTRIPLFVSLARVVGHAAPWLEAATEDFRAVHGPEIVDALDDAGRRGRLVVLLDGLDEVPPERRSVVAALRNFLERTWPNCPVVLSTRPLGRGELPAGYPRLDLLPLDEDRRHEFLVKWFEHGNADPARAQADAADALACFAEHRGLGELAGIPLYLTLLALLWQSGRRPPERLALLYDDIFEFLLAGRHRPESEAISAQEDVRSVLQHLAYTWTHDECLTESPKRLEQRLRSRDLDTVRSRLDTVPEWRGNLRRFLDDVYERTQILGPHDGRHGDWRFWHRTFREALTAEALHQRFGDDIEALADWARDLADTNHLRDSDSEGGSERVDGRGEGRWAEPLALLAGRLPEPDALVTRLAEVRPSLALRSMVFTQDLKADTLLTTLGLTTKLDERAGVFEKIPEQLGDARACLKLVEQLKEGRPGGFDLYWLGWILDQVKDRWPGFAKASRTAREHLYEHISAPPADLFTTVETRDGRTNLWQDIEAGRFLMGSPETEEGRYSDEGPQHEVVVQSPFQLATLPVTQAQYAVFEPEHRSRFQGDHRPVDSVTWYQAMAFCDWLGSHGPWKGARLPTEEEWEYACRAGSTGRFYNGDDDKALEQVAWYNKNSGGQTHEVGQKQPNNWGLYDMHGNVWEWTASPFESYAEDTRHIDPAALSADLAEPLPRVFRVLRGGSCWSDPQHVRSAYRVFRDPWDELVYRGFRVLLPRAPSDP